jgi:hypothetical protein
VTNTDPLLFDTDNDGLSDGAEVNIHNTDPNNPDSDGDNLLDGAEVNVYLSNPNDPDTDGDTMPDDFEVLNPCLNVLVNDAAFDPDGDAVQNVAELLQGTLPCNPDTDGDGFKDKPATTHAGTNTNPNEDNCILDANPSQLNTDGDFIELGPTLLFDDLTSPTSDVLGDACDPDADNDGLTNLQEVSGPPCVTASGPTNPLLADTDGDLAIDGAECFLGTNPNNPASKPPGIPLGDTDKDGLSDGVEAILGTNPNDPDTDGDGISDGVEFIKYGSNPLSTDSDGDGCGDGIEIASINADTVVNVIDLQVIATNFATPGSLAYIRGLDVNKDGAVNVVDLSITSSLFGSC